MSLAAKTPSRSGAVSSSARMARAPPVRVKSQCDELTTFWWYAEDLGLVLPAPAYDVAVEPLEGGCQVRIHARTLLRDLCLFVDRLDPAASVDDALLTVLPGETVTLRVGTGLALDREALSRPPCCAAPTTRPPVGSGERDPAGVA